MSSRIGINGFGRMGRPGFRAAFRWEDLQLVHVNEIACDAACSAYLLEFDSVHGRYAHECGAEDGVLFIDGWPVGYSRDHCSNETDWSGCDVVVEATGKFRRREQFQAYFDQGVQKVAVAAPVDGALLVILVITFLLLPGDIGQTKDKPKFTKVFSNVSEINWLAAARFFFFGSRDLWFVVLAGLLSIRLPEVGGKQQPVRSLAG